MAHRRRLSLITLLLSVVLGIDLLVAVSGCSDAGNGGAPEGLVRLDITDDDGKAHAFFVEPVLDNKSRFKGLSGRTHIDDDGGMIFVFPNSAVRKFVMRDCPIDIDIVYIDTGGRVIAKHAMKSEEPKREDESDADYEKRLKKYSSRFATDVVIELQAGTLERLGVEEGEVIKVYGLSDLKKQAK
ncbi:MAG TPA: DUF192 domain-containing protein [Phycisphaerales bacterium]|nr:DUF192 domain-containing protein [Phycisphaerales bacterium]